MKKNDNFIMKLLPTIQEKESSDGKYSILDVLVLLKYGTKIDFEMQLGRGTGSLPNFMNT